MLPSVLLLDHPTRTTANPPLDLSGLPSDRLRAASDGWYAVVFLGGATHRLWFPAEPIKPASYSVRMDFDADFSTRSRAADRFWRALTGRALGPPNNCITSQERARIGQALQALDGHLAGASYRTIAEVLFGTARVPSRGWKTDALRSKTIRLVELGKYLMGGGYRELLRPRRRKGRR